MSSITTKLSVLLSLIFVISCQTDDKVKPSQQELLEKCVILKSEFYDYETLSSSEINFYDDLLNLDSTIFYQNGITYQRIYFKDYSGDQLNSILEVEDGKNRSLTEYNYHKNGQLQRSLVINYFTSESSLAEYDESGNQTLLELVRNNQKSTTRNEYNEAGNILKKEMLTNDQLTQRRTLEYDDNQNLIKEIWFIPTTNVTDILVYEYDSRTQLISIMNNDAPFRHFKYNSEGLKIKEIRFQSNGVNDYYTYNYSNGFLTSTDLSNDDQNYRLYQEFEYFSNGGLSHRKTYSFRNGSNSVLTSAYFDQKGNQLEYIFYNNVNQPQFSYIRQFSCKML
ncbi:hypothetical protein [Jiulongibacter sediminis]|uniref:hypothetical protein n=1 Tax=Jiulongibacter sediminis TaxID=1605367 RepID=UPI0026EA0996|nr:hypothetical protein [Jiulongibacter sediminis]